MFEFFSVWKAIYWAVGLIGVGGTIILIAFFPLAFKVALAAVVRFFSFVLSYRIGCAIVAAIAVGFMVDYWRHSKDDAEFAERTAAFEQAQNDRDAGIEQRTETRVRKQIADEWIAEQGTQHDVQDFKDRLPPDAAFRVGADADKLRALAGSPVSGPSKGVPEAAGKGAAADHRVGNRLSRFGRRSFSRARHRQPAARRQGKL